MPSLREGVPQNGYGCAVEDHADCQASLVENKQVPLTVTQFEMVQLLCRTPVSFCNQISVNRSDLDLRYAEITYSWPSGKKQREQCGLL